MARSASNRTAAATPSTSRRTRTIPKTKPSGEERQLEAEPEEDDVAPDESGEDEVAAAPDDGGAEPPPAKARRGRKPGSSNKAPVAAAPVQNSRLLDTAQLADQVLAYGEKYDVHPIDVLNAVEGILRGTGYIAE